MKKVLMLLFTFVVTTASAQGVKPMPTLSVEGRHIVDQHGNHVVLHGVMDTPNAWFNGGRWGWSYSSVTPCLNYFEKIFSGLEEAKCDVFRLHLDPAWTNDPSNSYTYSGAKGQADDATGEADIKKFNPSRLKTYLRTLYFPLAKKAMNHGMYVVVRPPGVCPGNLQVGDYYQNYLMTVWDLFTQNDSIRKYPGQISIELANEPVSLKNAQGKDDAKALHDYFQPIVDKIRENGFTGIIWVPGTGWQSNYTSFAQYPIEGYNIGYAVHDYCGWYGCSDSSCDPQSLIQQFRQQVPVVDTAPIIITEVDWSPYKPGTGHYNEHGDWVESNYGTWSTGSTSKWGKAYKQLLDHYGNISMTLSGTSCLIDVDTLINKKKVVPAFDGLEEACGKACMDWYAEYYEVDWPHADFRNTVVSDLGNGKYQNPIIRADFPDPDVISVDGTYYMVTTTMHHFPGATIVKSKDLVNWEYCSQPLTRLSTKDSYSLLKGQNAYARGMWACSMAYHNGTFYILLNGNDAGGFVLTATDPEGKWELKPISRIYYDPGMMFEGGKVYVVCGNTEIKMCELDEDLNFLQEKTVFTANEMLEGCHLYHIGDYYYIYATYGGWPSGQTVLRSKNIFGPYEEKMLVEKWINNKPNTVHQGALIEVPAESHDSQWWTIMQEDLGCLGRMPNLQPVVWEDGWPVVGNKGVPYATFTKPDVGASYPRVPLPTNDNFRSYPIGKQWQWNHNPDDGAWSLFERAGWFRLRAGEADCLTQARNMLTQRIFAFSDRVSPGTVRLDISNLKEGDRAGICILQDPYAAIAVEVKEGKKQLVWWQDQLASNDGFTPAELTKAIDIDSIIYLRATVSYSTSKTQFYYSLDNKTFSPLGNKTTLGYNLSIFVGTRFGLFCYNQNSNSSDQTSNSQGYADFDWFSTENSFEESMFYPADFEGYNEDMLTLESLSLEGVPDEVMVGNSGPLQLIATYRDGHSDNVAAQARYEIDSEGVIEINGGTIRGLSEGTANVRVSYTDLFGNTLNDEFTVRSTFFPFGAQYICTSFFGQGVYEEASRTFRPSQYGQMGWEYQGGTDMSAYKYLVIKLAAFSSNSHLNIYTTPSIWGDGYSTPDFGQKKQIVVNLQKVKYTSGGKKGQMLETDNVCIVAFWGNGSQKIKVSDMYLTNNDDYSPNGINDVMWESSPVEDALYDLQGRRVDMPTHPGIYIKKGKKILVRE
ncbi:MAG: family 43 glycosylhydrolase [Bacteroidaceae bacterium]|nr:family 43 glycosylhydrolase [Bacteroidaceae bacterium]